MESSEDYHMLFAVKNDAIGGVVTYDYDRDKGNGPFQIVTGRNILISWMLTSCNGIASRSKRYPCGIGSGDCIYFQGFIAMEGQGDVI